MKDLFVGIAIGAVAGAMICNNPKTKQMMGEIKNKVKSCSCGCGGEQNGGEGGQDAHENRQDGGSDWQ